MALKRKRDYDRYIEMDRVHEVPVTVRCRYYDEIDKIDERQMKYTPGDIVYTPGGEWYGSFRMTYGKYGLYRWTPVIGDLWNMDIWQLLFSTGLDDLKLHQVVIEIIARYLFSIVDCDRHLC